MLHKKLLKTFSFLVLFSSIAYGQDLVRKVPKDANVFISINNKNVFNHLGIDNLNETLTRLGFFKEMSKSNIGFDKIENTGIDLASNAYLFFRGTDSVQYIGALMPLADVKRFESLITQERNIENVNGYSTLYSKDRTLRVSWDKKNVYVLGGIAVDNYFDRPEVQERFGIPQNPYNDYSYESYDYAPMLADSVETSWTAWDSIDAYVDTVMVDDYVIDVEVDTAYNVIDPEEWNDEEYDMVDSVLESEEYQDDYYLEYQNWSRQRDSIKNESISSWLNIEMERLVGGEYESYELKKSSGKSSNHTLAQIEVKNFNKLIEAYYPTDVFSAAFGFNPSTMNYGIEKFSGSVFIDKNMLKFSGDVDLDKEMASIYKEIYNKKINSKFYPFLGEETLGFVSLNLNTEAYLKHLPRIFDKYYGSWSGRYADVLGLGTTLFDIIVDEKAVSKVFKGDNLFVLNGVTKQEVTYTDYEYDDDFNYIEVERTKSETLPQFIWMFSSDDTRIFEKLISIGLHEDELSDLGGIYSLKPKSRSSMQIYVMIKNGIVFLGNDWDKMQAIQSNSFKGKGHSPYVNMVKKNRLAVLFNAKRIPDLVTDLEIPVQRSMEETIKEFAEYGNLYITSSGMKGNSFKSEAGIEFPDKNGNALAFLLSLFDRWASEYVN